MVVLGEFVVTPLSTFARSEIANFLHSLSSIAKSVPILPTFAVNNSGQWSANNWKYNII